MPNYMVEFRGGAYDNVRTVLNLPEKMPKLKLVRQRGWFDIYAAQFDTEEYRLISEDGNNLIYEIDPDWEMDGLARKLSPQLHFMPPLG